MASVEVTRRYVASVRDVFRAWIDPALAETWWGPEGFKIVASELDARPGGRFRFEMISPSGSRGATAGTFLEVVPNERLVFEMSEHCNCDLPPGDSPQVEPAEVTVEFHEDRDGTTVRVVHRGLSPEVVSERFRLGWSSGLECLARTLEEGRKVS